MVATLAMMNEKSLQLQAFLTLTFTVFLLLLINKKPVAFWATGFKSINV